MACGDKTDFTFPMEADIFYPIVEQTALGNVKKSWILDRTIACSFNTAGTAWKEELKPNVDITQDNILMGRAKEDIRVSSRQAENAVTNVIITNIRDKNCNHLYTETSGPRKGKSTIFEIATNQPFIGPFGNIEYYKIVIRRSENQGADV
jgi:hypothetical protein